MSGRRTTLSVHVLPEEWAQIDALQRAVGAVSRSQLIRDALQVFAIQKGHRIQFAPLAVDGTGKVAGWRHTPASRAQISESQTARHARRRQDRFRRGGP